MDEPSLQSAGHRTVPHTADIRIEAWADSRERSIAEAVLGTVESFLDISTAHPTGTHTFRLAASSDADLLAAVLDEVIYLLDTTSTVPVDIELEPLDDAVDVRFATIGAEQLPQVGAVPKAVSLHGLSLSAGPGGWSCSVTLDV
jgi:protein archease